MCGLAPLFLLLAASTGPVAAQAPSPASRALVTVRTLVIDSLGTRTVDTNLARVPFGGTGLLIRRVPYAGPPLSFRLAVTAGPPQEAGIALTIAADTWSGGGSTPPPGAQVSHREEATVVSSEGSYLFEIDHDEGADRRVVLSLSVRAASDEEMSIPPPAPISGTVRFQIEVTRECGGQSDPPDEQVLSTMVGLPVSYTSGMKVPAAVRGGERRFVGLSVTLTPERAQGDLITVRVELSGADFVDEARTRLEPIGLTESRTVSSGTRFELTVGLPSGSAAPGAEVRPVSYRVVVVPTLGV
ncbi:MAG TPA: hypothetical protein VGK94_06795 [Candidatus Polarisedimenticolia bacterium]|jgi:hypothetical protein